MSLISLIIGLIADRYLSATGWQFDVYFKRYIDLVNRSAIFAKPWMAFLGITGIILVPTLLVFALLILVDNTILHFVFDSAYE